MIWYEVFNFDTGESVERCGNPTEAFEFLQTYEDAENATIIRVEEQNGEIVSQFIEEL